MWDDLGGYVKKTVAAHHGCIKDHYAVLKQTAAAQAPDPARTAGQAIAEHAENRARVVRTRQRYGQVQKLKAEGMRIAAIQRELRLAPGTARATSTRPASMSWWRVRWPDGRACWTTTNPTSTSGGTRAAPTSSNCTERSRRWASAVATAPSTPISGPSRARRPRRPSPTPPKVRHITSWIRRRPDNLNADEQRRWTGWVFCAAGVGCAESQAVNGVSRPARRPLNGDGGIRNARRGAGGRACAGVTGSSGPPPCG